MKLKFKNWQILVLIIFGLSVSWSIFLPGYFSHHDDLQVMRIFEMRRCLQDLQIPCRWVPDMGYGFGFPLFNYYPVLPYYIGAVFSFFIGYVWAAKLMFLIPLILAGPLMYLFLRKLFDDNSAFFGGILFTFVPYRALDTYVRGALAESWAITAVPLLLYSSNKLIEKKTAKNILVFGLSVCALLLSHNVMTVLFYPILLFWVGILLLKNKFRGVRTVLITLFLGTVMASFFVLPAYLEKNLVRTDTLISADLNFRVHFVTFSQLFLDRSWGYGASVYGPNDTISFQVGWPHWWLVILAVILGIISWLKKKREKLTILAFWVVIFSISIFMTHNKSAFVWEKISVLQFAQFPWRFLAVSGVASSIIAAGGFYLIRDQKIKKYLLFVLIIFTIILNWNFFQPKTIFSNMNDKNKLSGLNWEEQQKASILDYLPKTAKEPKSAALDSIEIVKGDVKFSEVLKKSNYWEFKYLAQKPIEVLVPVFDFENWQIKLNNQPIAHQYDEKLGRIKLDLPAGEGVVVGRFEDTPLRRYSNYLSFLGAVVFLGFVLYEKNYRKG